MSIDDNFLMRLCHWLSATAVRRSSARVMAVGRVERTGAGWSHGIRSALLFRAVEG